MNEPILYETHMHTPLCKHATGKVEAYAEVGLGRNLKGITVTCHNPMPHGFAAWSRMDMNDFGTYLDLVQRAREAYTGRIEVRLGMECDYMPGYEDFLEQQVKWADFEYLLGSVHPFLQEYMHAFDYGDTVTFQKGYFSHLVMAAETGLFDCLSHPDIVKVMFAKEWELDKVLDHIKACLDRIADTGIAMELNTSGRIKKLPEFNPGMTMLKEMYKRGIPVVIGADAHTPERVSDHFEEAIACLREAGYEHVSYFLKRERQDIPLDVALSSLASPKVAG